VGDLSDEQRTPRVSRADVERIVRRDFPAADYANVLTILDEYGNENGNEGSSTRVQVAALKLALGDVKKLRRHIATARQDYRDVLSAAEYPMASVRLSAMNSLSEKERQNMYDSDWDQYQQWLEHR
jgi:hypothetical protein